MYIFFEFFYMIKLMQIYLMCFFTKLIEFLKNDSKRQLCFTTHNLEPIDVLKDKAHSLDFISNDSRVYSWIKEENRSQMNKYVNGLIPYSPFNIESFDFDLLLIKKEAQYA